MKSIRCRYSETAGVVRIIITGVILSLLMIPAFSYAYEEGTVTGLKANSSTFRKIMLTWNPVECNMQNGQSDKVTYCICRANSAGGEYSEIKRTGKCSYTDKSLTAGKEYTYMIKAELESGAEYFSVPVSASPLTKKKASLTLMKKGGSYFDLCKEAGESSSGYNILQGGCAHNKIAYLTLYNKAKEKCKIVKVRLKSMKVLKVSKVLKIYHGNSLAYNTERNVIAVACCEKKPKCIAEIDPVSLKIVRKRTIKLPNNLSGITGTAPKYYCGINAIAYNEKDGCYYARLKKIQDYIRLDNDMRPEKYIKSKEKKNYLTYQAIESYSQYIYDVQSFSGSNKYNMITARTKSGAYAGEMKVPCTSSNFELECVFHDGEQFYAGFYYSKSKKTGKKKKIIRHTRIYRVNNLI